MKKSRVGIFIVMAVSTFFFFSFFSKKTVENDVFIRIENKTNHNFKEVRLGQRIIKKNSYSSRSYETKFGNLAPNSKTEYENTTGKHIGYSRIRLSKDPSGYLNVPVSHIQQQVKLNSSSADPFEHPYTKELIEGYSLDKGYYTFVVSEKNQIGFIEIQRDNNL